MWFGFLEPLKGIRVIAVGALWQVINTGKKKTSLGVKVKIKVGGNGFGSSWQHIRLIVSVVGPGGHNAASLRLI